MKFSSSKNCRDGIKGSRGRAPKKPVESLDSFSAPLAVRQRWNLIHGDNAEVGEPGFERGSGS
jgi:hypothetical protein